MALYDRSQLKNFQDEQGVSLYLRRVTRVHREAERQRAYRESNPNHRLELNFNRTNSRLRDLFADYDRANYHDETGLTHLHVACEYGFYQVARELLEEEDEDGQRSVDPNCQWRETGDAPLHLAAEWNRKEVVELLLRNGASPNLANWKGETALHAICRKYNEDDFLERCLNICEERGQEVRIDAKDKMGNTPLHLALRYCHKTTIESLLRRGADRNRFNAEGETPLQIISDMRWIDDDVLDMFFKGCDDERQQRQHRPVLVDAQDITGRTPLHQALRREHKRMVRILLRAGADPNLAYAEGETPLHMICKRKSVSYVELFFENVEEVDRMVRVDARDDAGNTPLHYALALDHAETAELLLRRGADPNSIDADGSTALHALCEKYYTTGWTRRLFRAMSDERNHPRLRIDALDKYGDTALHRALRADNRRLVELLLDRGADPNLADSRGSAALHLVCRDLDLSCVRDPPRRKLLKFGRFDSFGSRRIKTRDKLMRLLLKKGADPNQVNAEGSTPLHVCLKNQDDDLVAIFLKNVDGRSFGIDARDNSGNTPLHLAVHRNNREMMKLLLKNGADPNLADGQEGFTPVLSICKGDRATKWTGTKHYDLVRVLFEHSQDRFKPLPVDGQDESGNTPLHLALRSENKNLAELLLKKGANPNTPNHEAVTPIHMICKGYWKVPLLKRVHELGGLVEIDRRDGSGDAPLHHAMRECDRSATEMLLRWGADPRLRNEAGATPLHVLCEVYTRQNRLVEWFFEICAELKLPTPINVQDNAGDSPLHVAVSGGHRLLTELLLRNGADPNLANEEGRTPLHVVCKLAWDNDLPEILFGVCDERGKTVEIDARDKLGNTPLHLALFRGHPAVTESLLLRGADPTLADGNGRTPAHIVCLRKEYWDDGDLVNLFFRLIQQLGKQVRLDCLDDRGRTPLQVAVATLTSVAVDKLLEYGVDLTNFVFPNDSYFGESFQTFHYRDNKVKLRLASGAFAVIDSLEQGGYEMKKEDAVTVMKFFQRHDLFQRGMDFERRKYDADEEMAAGAKKLMIKPDMSMYDVSQLIPEAAVKAFAYGDYFQLMGSKRFFKFFPKSVQPYLVHMFEIMTRGFFRAWALECFCELTQCILPFECYERILDKNRLTNRDLLNVCMAATGQRIIGQTRLRLIMHVKDF